MNQKLISFFASSVIIALSIYALIAAKDLLIPFVIAIVIWYLVISITSAIQKIPLFGWKLPYPIALLGAFFICGGIIYFIFSLITGNISTLMSSLPVYQERLAHLTDNFMKLFGIKNPPTFSKLAEPFSIVSFVTNIVQTVTSLASSAGIIFIYVLFLLLEHHSFDAKLAALIPDEKRFHKVQDIIRKISMQIQTYIRIKTLLSISTALISYAIMKAIGVDFAEFWSLLIFLLNFIPTIGSITATILPCLLTIVQFDSWSPFIIVSSLLITTQFLIGNVIEPKLIGKSINISGLVIIISLAFWGSIWGIAGMFLCVPIMVIANIILSNLPQTKPIAIILSRSGELD